MADAPDFIKGNRRPSLFVVLRAVAPELGWLPADLRSAAMACLWHCSKEDHKIRRPTARGVCCGRMLATLGRAPQPACLHMLGWMELEGALQRALVDGACREIVCTPELLAWLLTELNLPLPSWFEEWSPPPAEPPPPPAEPPPAEVPPAPPLHWHDRAEADLRKNGSPAYKPGGWNGWAEKIIDDMPPDETSGWTRQKREQFQVTVRRFGQRWARANL